MAEDDAPEIDRNQVSDAVKTLLAFMREKRMDADDPQLSDARVYLYYAQDWLEEAAKVLNEERDNG